MPRRRIGSLTLLLGAFVLPACAVGTPPTSSTTTSGTGASGATGGGGSGGDTTTGTGATGATGGSGGQGGAVCGDGSLDGENCDDGNVTDGDGCGSNCVAESGYKCAGEPSDCVPICGDGIVLVVEGCDDGNTNSDDGCSASCTIEDGYSCIGAPSECSPNCGDGMIAGAEVCDDGNSINGDGCSSVCAVEDAFDCTGEPSVCLTVCGDGNAGGPEGCDDSNAVSGDGCDAQCQVEGGFTCTGEPSTCVTTCGDSVIAGAEECDDANAIAGDGCNMNCGVEVGFVCVGEPSICSTVCGDQIVAGPEQCDDGDASPNDGCDSTCQIEAGYGCSGQPSVCSPICGDSLVKAPELCDDGDNQSGDGCSSTCQIEPGYTCSGLPSNCVTTCGDGIVAGTEACDDLGTLNGDGCTATCAIEQGYYCMGTPSACVTQCGDGIKAGTEQCDDGNTVSGDGCSSLCTPNTGETCVEPLVMAQATEMGGVYTWNVPSASVGATDGSWACDPNGVGPDVVAKYTKTSGNLAGGGKLLHVKADTPAASTGAYFLNVEVKSGACAAGSGTSLKCLWYKDNWDVYLDVPAGDYWIWVAKNSAATAGAPFPQVTLTTEEVNASSASGEGCFAPFTTASSNYTPPGGAGLPHVWTITDGTINSFDMASTWGEPGSISCDNTPAYGDITGVDAVITYPKASPTSVLKIDVQNLDPVLTQSDLNVELLNVCDPTSPSKISRNCRANKDTISMTAPSPQGDAYIWLTAEATGEELNGATVSVTEIFPGVGESWPTAQPIAGTGPITATSAQRLDAPSCFPAGVNIHWFAYTLTNDALSLTANLAGTVGIYDPYGQEVACVADAALSPIGALGAPGSTFYIAVQSPSTVTSLTIKDVAYSGVSDPTDMQVTFPTSAISEYGMAADANQIVMGDTASVFSFPKTIGAAAAEYGTANGITATHLGYDLVFAAGKLFSVDSTTTTTVSRLFRIYDGAVWGPGTPWDVTPSYPASAPSHAIATDGSLIFLSTRKTTANSDASFYTLSPAITNMPVLLGTKPAFGMSPAWPLIIALSTWRPMAVRVKGYIALREPTLRPLCRKKSRLLIRERSATTWIPMPTSTRPTCMFATLSETSMPWLIRVA
ncbi:MAG: DUF4215 domain-containing protein [Polyangiaceae bacterium]|nr:DUF4215 domain-containing protein [Polyangiaceae bacterium]